MSIFVIRPGETDFDLQDRVQGTLNLPLNAQGTAQVERMVEELRDCEIDTIYASPTEPALSSAQLLGEELEIPVKVLDQLGNLDLGLWQGLSFAEIRQKQPRVYRQWEDAPESVCPPLGETLDEAHTRVARALKKPMRRGGDYAVVASEPLATLVASVLKGERPQLCCPQGLSVPHSRIERLGLENPVGAPETASWTRQ
ncbi:histidine phosphatase family protein [Planctomicrobium sp. SH664]|uniref:histidine phosphatase family protein n=1 Tax=Planctomicrobium sp. SH664 TaxID=3448125 RepID=UPI003F5AFCC4